MKRYIFILYAFFFLAACQEEEVPFYSGKEYVQFKERVDSVKYSFVYKGEDIKVDTVWLKLSVTGPLRPYPRKVKFRQVKEYQFEFIMDKDGVVLDSILYEVENQAIPGLHYLPFDDESIQPFMQIKADSATTLIPVVLFRKDAQLKQINKRLTVEVISSEDLIVGDPITRHCLVIISDRLVQPTNWEGFYFGGYGLVKHQFLIDITGKKWDDEFYDGLTIEMKLYYNSIAAMELEKENERRKLKGYPPLMENPNDPRSVVKFM